MNPTRFTDELAGLPADIAAELEDHLVESYLAAVQGGSSPEEARRQALSKLGVPSEIARRCREVSQSSVLLPGVSRRHQVVVMGWLLLAPLLASRICVAFEPTPGSIATSIGISGIALALAMAVRRKRIAVGPATAVSVALSAGAFLSLVQVAWHPWIENRFAIRPELLGLLAVFGAFSAAVLRTTSSRTFRWA
jgi:hypothetical protein